MGLKANARSYAAALRVVATSDITIAGLYLFLRRRPGARTCAVSVTREGLRLAMRCRHRLSGRQSSSPPDVAAEISAVDLGWRPPADSQRPCGGRHDLAQFVRQHGAQPGSQSRTMPRVASSLGPVGNSIGAFCHKPSVGFTSRQGGVYQLSNFLRKTKNQQLKKVIPWGLPALLTNKNYK